MLTSLRGSNFGDRNGTIDPLVGMRNETTGPGTIDGMRNGTTDSREIDPLIGMRPTKPGVIDPLIDTKPTNRGDIDPLIGMSPLAPTDTTSNLNQVQKSPSTAARVEPVIDRY